MEKSEVVLCDRGVIIEFYKYSLSHNLSLPDGFIAATAIVNQIPLYTLNKKDFQYIRDIKLWN